MLFGHSCGLEQASENGGEAGSSQELALTECEERARRRIVGLREEPAHCPYWAGCSATDCDWECAGCSKGVTFGGFDFDGEVRYLLVVVSSKKVSTRGVGACGGRSKLRGSEEGMEG